MIQTERTNKKDLNAVIRSSIISDKALDVDCANNILNIYNMSSYISSLDNALKSVISNTTYYKTVLEEQKRITGNVYSYVYDNVMYCYVKPYKDSETDSDTGMYRLHQYYSTDPGNSSSEISEEEYNDRVLNGAEKLYYATDAFQNKNQYLRKHDGSWPSNQVTVVDDDYDHCLWIKFDTLNGRYEQVGISRVYNCYWYTDTFSLYSKDPPQSDGTEPTELITAEEAQAMIDAGYLPIYYCVSAKTASIYIQGTKYFDTTWEPYMGHLKEVYAGQVQMGD
jgi:hypothetical protein